MSSVKIDTKEYKDFFKKMIKAGNSEFKKEIGLWYEALGFELLDIVQDEIKRKGVVDTRLLFNSFEKGTSSNVWITSNGGLTLEVGTNVKYAEAVNNGHWTNPKGVETRWVPGEWRGDKFEYKRGAKTGMLLRQQFVKGYHYWDSAQIIFEKIFGKTLEKKLEEWLIKYF
jgi:hypothetical protein